MVFDLMITNGMVVDGTGAPAYKANVAISAGKIVAIGSFTGNAARVIDAKGHIVAPGFIDPHTHYDAQICWDAELTPSSWHGVTTAMVGNCGVGIAPCRPAEREATMQDLVNVESIPFDVLEKGINWSWENFPAYMDAAEHRHSAINLAFLAPLTPFRRYVMGDAAAERAATVAETAQIKSLIKDSVEAGAFGFSTTVMQNHIGHEGKPVGCRNASREEIAAYCSALAELDKGVTEVALTNQVSVLSDEDCALLDLMLSKSGRKVTWLSLLHRDDIPEACQSSLAKAKGLLERGALPQISPLPLVRELDMRKPFALATFQCFSKLFNQPAEIQAQIYADPVFRNAFRAALKGPGLFSGDWERIKVVEIENDSMKTLEGMTIAEIARDHRKDGVDTLLDVALSDDLKTQFSFAVLNATDARIPELLNDSRTLIGLGDAGAHVDILCDADYPTFMLGKWVRELKAMSLEHGVKRLTSEPADFFGIRNRGKLATGFAADIVVFDADHVGSTHRAERRFDLPGGAKRLVMRSQGVEYTIVNGTVTYAQGKISDARAGQVLRS